MLKVDAQKLGNVGFLRLQGRIAIGETMMLSTAVRSQLNASGVVLDLGRVNGIDAHGLGTLLELREWTKTKGIKFRLVNVTRLVQQVFEITCLDRVFDIAFEGEAPSAAALPNAEATSFSPFAPGSSRIPP